MSAPQSKQNKAPGVTGPASLLVKVRASETHCGAVALSRNSPFVLCYILALPSHGHPGSFRMSPPVQVLALLSRRNSVFYENNFVSKGSNASRSPQLLTLQLRRGWGDKPVSFLEALQSLRGPTQNCHGFDTVTNAVCPASFIAHLHGFAPSPLARDYVGPTGGWTCR